MKKIIALLLALCMLLPMAAMADETAPALKIGQVLYAPNGTGSFAVATVVVDGDVIVAAHIEEFQFMDAGSIGVPNSDGDFGKGYAEGKVLASKRVNTVAYSKMMADYAGSTVTIDANYDAIAAFVVGMTVTELETLLASTENADMVDIVSGATLVATKSYMAGLLDAAKAAK